MRTDAPDGSSRNSDTLGCCEIEARSPNPRCNSRHRPDLLARAKNPSTPRVRGYVQAGVSRSLGPFREDGDGGLIVFGINVPWDKEQLVCVFMDAYKVTYLVGRDASGTIGNLYGVEATPTSLFIDKAGRLVEQHAGALPEAEFPRRVGALLK